MCYHVIAMLVYVVFESINEKFGVLFLVLVYSFIFFLWDGSQGMEDFTGQMCVGHESAVVYERLRR